MIEVETRGLVAKEMLLAERQITQQVTRKLIHDLAGSVMPFGLAREYLLRLATSPQEKDRQHLINSLKSLETAFENTRQLIFVLRDTAIGAVKPNSIRKTVSDLLGNVPDFFQSSIQPQTEIATEHAVLMEPRRFHYLINTVVLNAINALKQQPTGRDRLLTIRTSDRNDRIVMTVKDNRCTPFSPGEAERLKGAVMPDYEACRWLVQDHGGVFTRHTIPGESVETTMDLPMAKSEDFSAIKIG